MVPMIMPRQPSVDEQHLEEEEEEAPPSPQEVLQFGEDDHEVIYVVAFRVGAVLLLPCTCVPCDYCYTI